MGGCKNKQLGLTRHRKNKRLLAKRRIAMRTLWSTNPDTLKNGGQNAASNSSLIIEEHTAASFSTTTDQPSTSASIIEQEDWKYSNNSQDSLYCSQESTPCEKEKVISDSMGGRRIVEVQSFIEQILSFPHHGLFSCSSGSSGNTVRILKEVRKGFISEFVLICDLCKVEHKVYSDKTDGKLNTNGAAVLGAISIGCGFSQLNEFVSAMNIPEISYKRYKDVEDNLQEIIEEESWKCMIEAGKKEAEMAKENGDVDENDIPMITVIADGAWCKRSYRSAYNARSGAACIVGQRTGKLLFLGIRNKFCAMCHMGGMEHVCFKNWDGTSTGMESDIILEGFKQSISIHGLKYAYLVGDGDSSVLKRLQAESPYVVEKIECSNHLLRNYCTNLKNLATKKFSSKGLPIAPFLRQFLKKSIQRLRTAVDCAVKYRRSQDVSFQDQVNNLKKDIENSVSHVFGEHKKCDNYFCKGDKPNEFNQVSTLKQCGLYNDIMSFANRLIYNSKSLIKNMTNNSAESYNSVVAKFIGGKRVDFSKRGGYKMRCQAASICYNTGVAFQSVLHKAITDKSPGFHTKKFIERKKKLNCKRQLFQKTKKSNKKQVVAETDEDYGDVEEILDTEELTRRTNVFLRSLKKTKEEILEIAENTKEQRQSALWFTERRKRITASMFGKICKLRPTTNPGKTIKNFLQSFSSKSTSYGIEHEPIAITEFSEYLEQSVEPSGFYIDEQANYLGASPDGLIGSNGLVEIKCPYSCRTLTPQEAILTKKITYAIFQNDNMHLKQNHNYFYQVQGQLHIINRDFCYFVVWTPKGFLFEKIQRDDEFFENNMSSKLNNFYFQHFLPYVTKLPQ